MVAMVACEWIFRVHYPKPGGEEHQKWLLWLLDNDKWPCLEELDNGSYNMLNANATRFLAARPGDPYLLRS